MRVDLFSMLVTKKSYRGSFRGITLVEVMIIVTLSLMLAASAAPIYSRLNTFAQLNDGLDQLTHTIRFARQRSVSGYNNTSHGVRFETDGFVLFQGSSYLTRNSEYDRSISFGESINIFTDIPANEVIFSMGLGIPTKTGIVTLTHSSGNTKVIEIKKFGVVD